MSTMISSYSKLLSYSLSRSKKRLFASYNDEQVKLKDIDDLFNKVKGLFDFSSNKIKLESLQQQMEDPNIWGNVNKLNNLAKEVGFLRNSTSSLSAIEREINENKELFSIIANEGEKGAGDMEELSLQMENLKSKLMDIELDTVLNNIDDNKSEGAFIEINAGAGGNDSCDFVEMLEKMYLNWAHHQSFNGSIISSSPTSTGGFNSVTLQVEGFHAYNWIKRESGVHRLVRISPFDANNKRHTSFASVQVSPLMNEDADSNSPIHFSEKDLKIDTFKSSGPGGQHVNSTESSVRLTHIPSGVVASCQNERNQHQNKEMALKLLKSKLMKIHMDKVMLEKKKMNNENEANSFGSQIRTYCLHPYQQVKDHRSNYKTSNAKGVLDGSDLHEFLRSNLLVRG